MIPPIASNFIAGKSRKDALDNTKYLEQYDIVPIYNNLGEHYNNTSDVDKCVTKYKELIDSFEENSKAEISVKPTQIGLDINYQYFEENAIELLEYADQNNVFVWFDMEKPETIDHTLDVYKKMLKSYNYGCGVCLQVNMKRTEEDIKTLSNLNQPSIRLVKGAYSSNSTIDPSKNLNKRYKELIDLSSDHIGNRLAIGSHDGDIIEHCIKSDITNLEFQMLRGVKENKQIELARNYKVCQYIPYGSEWISYTYRRIKERPKNIFLIYKSVKNKIT